MIDTNLLNRATELQTLVETLEAELEFIQTDLAIRYPIHQLMYREFDYNQYSTSILAAVSSSLSGSLYDANEELSRINCTQCIDPTWENYETGSCWL